MNTEGVDAAGGHGPVTDAEKWILARLAATAADAGAHFASYRFDLLAQALYEFTWDEFCDWFLELAKPALNGADAAAADSTRRTLLRVLETLLRLLHPLIPFVTEELWRQVAPRLGIEGDTVSLQRYPQAADFDTGGYGAAEADVEWLKQMVSALRRIRSELGVSPSRQVPLLVQPPATSDQAGTVPGATADRERLQRFDAQLRFLNRLEHIAPVEGDPPPSATGLVGELKLFVPLEGLVDLDAERARLDRELARVSAEKEKSAAKLARFSDKVPAAVVEQERRRLADWTAQHENLSAQRSRLS